LENHAVVLDGARHLHRPHLHGRVVLTAQGSVPITDAKRSQVANEHGHRVALQVAKRPVSAPPPAEVSSLDPSAVNQQLQVPEPSAILALVSGFGVLALRRRRLSD